MQTTPSTIVRLRARTDAASSVSAAVSAFAVLVFRYARCNDVAIVVGGRTLHVSIESSTTIADLLASLPSHDVLASLVGARKDLSLAWSENDARLTLTVQVPSLAIV